MKWKRSKKAQQDTKKDHASDDKKAPNKEPTTEQEKPQLADMTAVKPPAMLDRDRIIALERERAIAAANFNSNLDNRRGLVVMNQDGGRSADMFRPYVV